MDRDVDAAPNAIVLFDGDCLFCNAALQFVVERDPQAQFRFASLQSQLGGALSERAGTKLSDASATMLLLEGGRLYQKSDAAFRVARKLGRGPWGRATWRGVSWLGLRLPRALRDSVYTLVARNRHRLVWAAPTCWLPTEELRRRLVG